LIEDTAKKGSPGDAFEEESTYILDGLRADRIKYGAMKVIIFALRRKELQADGYS